MVFPAANKLLLLLLATAGGAMAEGCYINHTVASTGNLTTDEILTQVAVPPGHQYLTINVSDTPYAPEGGSVLYEAWCIDLDRWISAGNYSMDLFSALDTNIHNDAVDKPENFGALAWIVNNYYVGSSIPQDGTCPAGVLTELEFQHILWLIMDDGVGVIANPLAGATCRSQNLANEAVTNHKDYEIDCEDDEAKFPLVFIVDRVKEDGSNEIEKQVLMSPVLLSSITGYCTCKPVVTGDPHFKTWRGEKFDYHGECDLVLIDHPTFADGLGLRLHVRTTRVGYFSYIEEIALAIGTNTLVFANDAQKALINGEIAKPVGNEPDVLLSGYQVRLHKNAVSVRLDEHSKAKIDFHTSKIGFPGLVVDDDHSAIFKGCRGLLGEWGTGRKLARDGQQDMKDGDTSWYALEWQVRDNEPMLFPSARAPQFPKICNPPKKMMLNRLGMSHMRETAEKVCAGWKPRDKEDCIFDVIATRNVLAATDGMAAAH